MTADCPCSSDFSINADFALVCPDDSMINSRIFPGDVVYIRQQSTVENGGIAAIQLANQEIAMLRKIYRFEGSIMLHPDNPTYHATNLYGDEIGAVRILGKAVAVVHTLETTQTHNQDSCVPGTAVT